MVSNSCAYAAGNAVRSSHGEEEDGQSRARLPYMTRDENGSSCVVCLCKMNISSKGGNTINMPKQLSTNNGLNFQEFHIFDSQATTSSSKQLLIRNRIKNSY